MRALPFGLSPNNFIDLDESPNELAPNASLGFAGASSVLFCMTAFDDARLLEFLLALLDH